MLNNLKYILLIIRKKKLSAIISVFVKCENQLAELIAVNAKESDKHFQKIGELKTIVDDLQRETNTAQLIKENIGKMLAQGADID